MFILQPQSKEKEKQLEKKDKKKKEKEIKSALNKTVTETMVTSARTRKKTSI